MKKQLAFLSLIMIFLFACGGGSSDSGGSGDNLRGLWVGSAFSNPTNSAFGNVRFQITSDDGINFSGTLSSPQFDAACGRNFSIAGTRNGSTISFGGGLNGQTVMRFQASITGQSIGGGYQVLLGSCAGDFGSFCLTRS